MKTLLSFTFKTALVLGIIALVVGGIARAFFIDMIVVGHNGMAPTMIVGEEVLMWRGAEDLQMGDIPVCAHPSGDGRMVFGRVVGKNTVVVDSQRGQLRVDGQVLRRDLQGTREFTDAETGETETMVFGVIEMGNTDFEFFRRERTELNIRPRSAGMGKIFLLGDNHSPHAHDSRSFGGVTPANCMGTVFMRWKPVDDGSAELGHGWFDIL